MRVMRARRWFYLVVWAVAAGVLLSLLVMAAHAAPLPPTGSVGQLSQHIEVMR